jgi:hypothetical protein
MVDCDNFNNVEGIIDNQEFLFFGRQSLSDNRDTLLGIYTTTLNFQTDCTIFEVPTLPQSVHNREDFTTNDVTSIETTPTLEAIRSDITSSHRPHLMRKLRMFYQNVRGLRTKTKTFKLSSTRCTHDIVALSETGLHSSIFDGELFTNNEFSVYRCDRSDLNSIHGRLGGVLIAVRSNIPSERVDVPMIEHGTCCG